MRRPRRRTKRWILDGQQRATSIFGVFQNALSPLPGEDASILEIYFDLTQDANVQDSNFIHVPANEVDPEKHFPLRLLFNPPEYRKFLKTMPEEIATKVDTLHQRFTTARIPHRDVSIQTDDRTAVARFAAERADLLVNQAKQLMDL